jgi:hemerythrin
MNTCVKVLEWSDAFATGVAEMDEQHMILVETLNEASVNLSLNRRASLLEQVVLDLLSYALYHFETEEHLMEQYGYAESAPEEAARHLEQHRAFSAQIVSTHKNLRYGAPVQQDEIVGFVNDWLNHHILKTDARLGTFILNKRNGEPRVATVG